MMLPNLEVISEQLPMPVSGLSPQDWASALAKSPQDWADLIAEAHHREVMAIIVKGRLLLAAKEALRHGQWMTLFKGTPGAIERPLRFGVGTAELYMVIAKNPLLTNSKCISILPPRVGTLADLARLPQSRLQDLLASGQIHPDLKRHEVDAFLEETAPHLTRRERRLQKTLAARIDDLLKDQEALIHYRDEVTAELNASLQFSGVGKIVSGIFWLPPFLNPPPPRKAKPKHRCPDCGHEHSDLR